MRGTTAEIGRFKIGDTLTYNKTDKPNSYTVNSRTLVYDGEYIKMNYNYSYEPPSGTNTYSKQYMRICDNHLCFYDDIDSAECYINQEQIRLTKNIYLGDVKQYFSTTLSADSLEIGTTNSRSTIKPTGISTTGSLTCTGITNNSGKIDMGKGQIAFASGQGYAIVQLDSKGNTKTLITMGGGNDNFYVCNSAPSTGINPSLYIGNNSYANTVLAGKAVRLGSTSGTVVTSDERMKMNLELLSEDERYDNFFMSVDPKRYKYINGTSGRYHVGMSAQQILESLEKNNLSSEEFGGIVKLEVDDETPEGDLAKKQGFSEVYGIIYNEFVGLNISATQKNRRMIQELQNEVKELKAMLAELKK